MAEEEKIPMPSTEECIEAVIRDLADRPNISMTYLETLKEAERRAKKHFEWVRKLEAVARVAKDILDSADEFTLEGGTEGFDGCYIDVAKLRELRETLADLEGGDSDETHIFMPISGNSCLHNHLC